MQAADGRRDDQRIVAEQALQDGGQPAVLQNGGRAVR